MLGGTIPGNTGDADFYTRVSLVYVPPNAQSGLQYQPTGTISSWIEQPAKSYLASVAITTKTYTATVPLVSVSHASTRSGENWARAVDADQKDFPWFLVTQSGQNGVANIQLTVSASESYDLQAVSSALRLATSVANLSGPQNQLVTSLTSAAASARADVLDSTISAFMTKSISERPMFAVDLLAPGYGGTITIRVAIPTEQGHAGEAPIGATDAWQISFAERRPSIFSDIRVCKETDIDPRCRLDFGSAANDIVKSVDMSRVLGFSLVTLAASQPLLTVGQYLQQQADYPTMLLKLAKVTLPNDPTYRTFCGEVQGWMTNLGFSSLDSKLVAVAAAINQNELPDTVRTTLYQVCRDFSKNRQDSGNATSSAIQSLQSVK